MNSATRTYGIVINMDYEHHRPAICKALWDRISNHMKAQQFTFDKRMFIISTDQGQEEVCHKARQILEELECCKETYEKRLFHYVKDFYAVDMTDYLELPIPVTSSGIEVHEDVAVDDVKFN